MKKLSRNYRLSKKTVQQIDDLVRTIGSSDATSVITLAVEEKHQRFLAGNSTRLVKGRDGEYDVIKVGLKIGTVEASQVERIPEKRRSEFLGPGVLHGEIELLLDVAAGRGNEIELNPDDWKKSGNKK